MPDSNSQDFQAELELLREQVKARLEAHRLEVEAAIARLADAHSPDGDWSEMRARVAEWERRERELGERIAARNVEYQALRARLELERYGQQARVADLEKQLVLREAETGKLKLLLDGLMAEHAECCRRTPLVQADPAYVQALMGELEASRMEAARMRDAMENSVALRVARSLGWFLRPVRGLLGKRPGAAS